jgi:hypothetical protein
MDRPSLTGTYSGAYRADERNPAQLQQQPHYPPWIVVGFELRGISFRHK